jgi:hypothetical protein
MKNNFAGHFSTLITALLMGLPAKALHGDIVTDSAQIPNATVINFDGLATVSDVPGPIQVGGPVGMDIKVSGTPDPGLYTNYDGWGFGANGVWRGTFVGMTSSAPESIIVSFNDGPVAAVGVFTNYYPDAVGAEFANIAALDKDMQVLEEYNLGADAPIVTSGEDDTGAFRGISRQSNEIYHFRVMGDAPAIDDLTFFQHTTEVNVTGSFSLSEFTTTGAYAVQPDPLEASFSVVVNINDVILASNDFFRIDTVLDFVSPSPLTVGTETFTADQISLLIARTPTEDGASFHGMAVILGIGDIGRIGARTNDFRTEFNVMIDEADDTLPRTIDIMPVDDRGPHLMVNEPINGAVEKATVVSGSVSLSVRGESIFEDGFEGL